MEGRGTEGRIHNEFWSRLHRLWVFKSRVLIYIYIYIYIRRWWRILRSQQLNDVYTSPNFIWVSNQGEWNGLGTWHVWGRRQMLTEFGGGDLKERDGLIVKKNLTCLRCSIVLQIRFWRVSHDSLTVSLTLVEMITNSLSVGRKVVTLPPDLPVERLVICLGNLWMLACLKYNSGKIYVIY